MTERLDVAVCPESRVSGRGVSARDVAFGGHTSARGGVREVTREPGVVRVQQPPAADAFDVVRVGLVQAQRGPRDPGGLRRVDLSDVRLEAESTRGEDGQRHALILVDAAEVCSKNELTKSVRLRVPHR